VSALQKEAATIMNKPLTEQEQAIKELAAMHAKEQGLDMHFRQIVTCGISGHDLLWLVQGVGQGVCADCDGKHETIVNLLYMYTPQGYLLLEQKSIKSLKAHNEPHRLSALL
jgi:hypothetical protein